MTANIDIIEEMVIDAEISVLNALCECYQKQIILSEQSYVFQESVFERDPNESKIKTILLLPLRLIGSLIKLLKRFVKMCRNKINQMRSKKNNVSNGEFDPKFSNLKPRVEDGETYITSEIDIDLLNFTIENFDTSDIDKMRLPYKIYNQKEYTVPDYSSKVEKICNTIEKSIIPKLQDKLDEYNIDLKNARNSGAGDDKNNRDKIHKIEKDISDLKKFLSGWNNVCKKISNELSIVMNLLSQNQNSSKDNFTFKSIDENTFRQAIRDKDYLALKVSTVSTMLDDPTFERGETMKAIQILKDQVPEIFEDEVKLDYEERLEKSAWDKRYFTKLTYWFQENFAISRISYIREVGRVVHRDTAEAYNKSKKMGGSKRDSRKNKE